MSLNTYEVELHAYLLTNIDGTHALTVWRRYNSGALVEQQIDELTQLLGAQGRPQLLHLDDGRQPGLHGAMPLWGPLKH